MWFVILGFLAMVLFEMVLRMAAPKSFEDEVMQKLDLNTNIFENCVLNALPKDFQLPLNLTCNSTGFIVPAS